MNKKTKKIIGWVIYLALLVGLVLGTPRALAFLLKTPYPMASITSGSMWPVLKKGDLVFIKGISGKEEISAGDILVYENNMGFTIHRAVELREDEIITKGDANNTADAPIGYDEVVGKAVKLGSKTLRIPLLGNVSLFLNKPKANF